MITGGFVKGGSKLGKDVYTYSRTPIDTCPGASDFCRSHCYALKIKRYPTAWTKWAINVNEALPPIPAKARLVRIHVGGDFDSVAYIDDWVEALTSRPDVTAWSYTRSWRVPELLPALERLRGLPNMQLFASVDPTITDTTPTGWRVAYVVNDWDSRGYACPEQTGRKDSCQDCGYCFRGQKNDVQFKEH